MYTLYWSPDTGAFVVQAVLEELGLPYRIEPVLTGQGEHRRPEYLAVSPLGHVPALRLEDGTVMTETAAMVLHLCDLRQEAGLLPPPGTTARADAYRWLLFMAVNIYEADLRYVYAARYTTDPGGAAGVREAALRQLDHLFDLVEESLSGPYLLGRTFSACDHYLFMLALWHPARAAHFERRPRLGRLAREMRQRLSIQRIWSQHFPEGGDGPWSTWTG